jgi:DNA-directed RNA polymerase subunit RPC12/RpoP
MSAPAPALSGLWVGAQGKLRGRPFTVVGRARYRYGRGFWDEWFLQDSDGKLVWLSEDEGEFCVETERALKRKVPPFDKVQAGSVIELGDFRFTVEEKDSAVLESGEGELPFKAVPGEALPYLDGSLAEGTATLEYDEDGPRLFAGDWLALPDLEVERRAAPRQALSISCPSCGGTLALRLADEAEMAVCEYCGSRLDVRKKPYTALGSMLRAGPKLPGLRVGLSGRLRGVNYEIVGRLRYRDITP